VPAMIPTNEDVEEFISRVKNPAGQEDARTLCRLMSDLTGEPAVMWGKSIVGFGTHHYRYESGREGDSPLAAFSPRATQLVIYLIGDFAERHARLLSQLGPHTTGKSCLYLKRLDDVDLDVLRQLIHRSNEVARGVDRQSRGD